MFHARHRFLVEDHPVIHAYKRDQKTIRGAQMVIDISGFRIIRAALVFCSTDDQRGTVHGFQAALAKQGNFYTLLNNTIVRQTRQGGIDTDGAVVCLADDGTAEGAGMYLEGNIIFDAENLGRNLSNAVLTISNTGAATANGASARRAIATVP